MNKNPPASTARKAAVSAVILFLSVFRFSPAASAQSLDQLNNSVPAVEIPLAPVPGNATLYTAAPGLNVYFLSVGQGDSIYLELPNGQNALIDGGPSKSATGALAQFLSQKKVSKIDYVVLTHPHADHYKGLQYVFSAITVGNFYDTRMDNTAATGDEALRSQVKALGVNTFYPAPGDDISWGPGGLGVKVFNSCPEPVQSSDGSIINNCSLTIKVTYQNASMLFVGDDQSDAEARMVARFGAELKSDVLKVGHHGSPYSSSQAFLETVMPKKAFIEVGKNNYGHPAQSSIDRIKAVGASVFRSDLDGTQEFSVDGLSEPVEPSED